MSQVSTYYTLRFPRYSPDKIFKLKVTAARSNQGQTMTLHTYTTQPMSLPPINFLHLRVSEMQPRQTFSRPSGHHGRKQLDLRIGEPMQICIHQKDNSLKPVNHHLTLKEGSKVKSNMTRFLAKITFLRYRVGRKFRRNRSSRTVKEI